MGKKHKQTSTTKSWQKEGRVWTYKTPEDPEVKYADHPKLYVAYGSNLNVLQMQQRCPTAMPVTDAVLKDFALRFSSVCTIERLKGSSCPVAIWQLEPADIAALDRYEGFPNLYSKRDLTVTILGTKQTAFTYVLNPPYDIEPPWATYFDCVEEGYMDWQMDDTALYDALDHSYEHFVPLVPLEDKDAYTLTGGYDEDANWTRLDRDYDLHGNDPGWWNEVDKRHFDYLDEPYEYHQCCLCQEWEVEDLMICTDAYTDTWVCCDCDWDIYASAKPDEEIDLAEAVRTRQWWQEAEEVAATKMDADDPGDQGFDPTELDYQGSYWHNDLQKVDYQHYLDL